MAVRDYIGRKTIINTPLVERLGENAGGQGDSGVNGTVQTPYDYPQLKPGQPVPAWQQVKEAPAPGNGGMIIDASDIQPIGAVQAYQNNPQPTISDRVAKGESLFDILEQHGRPVDYEAEQKKLKRERNVALIGDLAGLVGDSIGLALGSRQFSPRQSATARVNDKMQRLQDFKRNDDVNYSNQELQAKYKDYELERAQRKQDAKLAYEKYKDEIEQGKWGAEMKLKFAKLNRDLANDKITQDRWEKKFSETVRQHEVVNQQGQQKIAIAGKNAENARSDASRRSLKKTSGEKEDMITVYDDKGNAKKISSRLISANDYWKYAKNALVAEGVINAWDSMEKVYKAMGDRGVYQNAKLKELNKVGTQLFGSHEVLRKGQPSINEDASGWSLKDLK